MDVCRLCCAGRQRGSPVKQGNCLHSCMLGMSGTLGMAWFEDFSSNLMGSFYSLLLWDPKILFVVPQKNELRDYETVNGRQSFGMILPFLQTILERWREIRPILFFPVEGFFRCRGQFVLLAQSCDLRRLFTEGVRFFFHFLKTHASWKHSGVSQQDDLNIL